MDQIDINTAQNVSITQNMAGISDRLLAYLIDSLIIVAYMFSIGMVVFNIPGENPKMIAAFLFFLPVFLYHLLMEIFNNGQSLGKKARDIKVANLDGSQPGIGGYVLRWMLRPVDFWLSGSVALICILAGKKGQRLGDMAAGTTVIKQIDYEHYLDEHSSTYIDSNYEPIFPEAVQLKHQDLDLIRTALHAKVEQLNEQPVNLLADKLKARLKITTDMGNSKFLNTLLKDHEALNRVEEV